jgi:hypothetical protein
MQLGIRPKVLPVCILIIFGALPVLSSPDHPSNIIEIKYGGSTRYLGELGLSADNLTWGPETKGIRLGAIFIPARDTGTIAKKKMILAIQNNSKTDLFIPVVNELPHFYCESASGMPPKLLFHYPKDFSFSGPDLVELKPGYMISFFHNYLPSFLDLKNKDHVPMIFALDFEGLMNVNPPDYETNLVLKSGTVQFP